MAIHALVQAQHLIKVEPLTSPIDRPAQIDHLQRMIRTIRNKVELIRVRDIYKGTNKSHYTHSGPEFQVDTFGESKINKGLKDQRKPVSR